MISSKELREFRQLGYFPFPKIVQIEITNKCPFQCPQCYKKNVLKKDMPFDRLIDLINICNSHGTELFCLNGGEPLIYPHFVDVIAYLTEKKIPFNCFTSGYGLTDEIIEYTKKGYLKLFVSLNGSTEEINKLSRDGYSYALQSLKALDSQNAPYMVNWVARHDNVHDFPYVVQLAMKYHAKLVSVIGNKLINNQFIDSEMSVEDYKFMADYLISFSHYDKIQISIEQCFPTLSALVPSIPMTSQNGCMAGVYICCVTVDGSYMPCTQLNYKESFNNIYDYWQHSEILEKLRKIKKENLKFCKDCPIKYCRTCRSISLECHNDFSMGYRLCPVRNQ